MASSARVSKFGSITLDEEGFVLYQGFTISKDTDDTTDPRVALLEAILFAIQEDLEGVRETIAKEGYIMPQPKRVQ